MANFEEEEGCYWWYLEKQRDAYKRMIHEALKKNDVWFADHCYEEWKEMEQGNQKWRNDDSIDVVTSDKLLRVYRALEKRDENRDQECEPASLEYCRTTFMDIALDPYAHFKWLYDLAHDFGVEFPKMSPEGLKLLLEDQEEKEQAEQEA